jgi:hypothetical protein
MPAPRHCRHCWGNCDGDCLVRGVPGYPDLCIHMGRYNAPPLRRRMRLWLAGLRRNRGPARRLTGA